MSLVAQTPSETLYRELVSVRRRLESLVDSTNELRDELDWKERLFFVSSSRDIDIELEKALADAEAMIAKAEQEMSGCNVVSLSSLSRLNKGKSDSEKACPEPRRGKFKYSLIPPPVNPVNINDVRHLETQLVSKGCRVPVPLGTKPLRKGKISDILNSRYGLPEKHSSITSSVSSLVDYVGTNIVTVKSPDEARKVMASAVSSMCSDIMCSVVERATVCLENDSSNHVLRLCDTIINDGFPRVLVKKMIRVYLLS